MKARNAALAFEQAHAEFENAWRKPKHTAIELAPVNVNKVLSERYITDKPIRLTGSLLWDMERKKAWSPDLYIPYVASSARSWGRSPEIDGFEKFQRTSMQKGWAVPQEGQINEDVYIDNNHRRVLFLGREYLETDQGEQITASKFQPLFHVEHAVGGTEDEPTNLWRIVVLSEAYAPEIAETFVKMVAAGWLPGFLEIYIQRDLGVSLKRR
ncbi:hypothetical protein HJA87_20905 [Rhizobium bangladeshense]|uniref:Uncharacterized protein n=1 Tax=Rhizobium bangladeshense TaxID=1138189 RepID=A0ABS7LML4_9HYPH|nr:hypothetical protein [Rhizobium bangladeshense]MBY3592316.1 hypothetical protein [Rhizobium bangladeshense]